MYLQWSRVCYYKYFFCWRDMKNSLFAFFPVQWRFADLRGLNPLGAHLLGSQRALLPVVYSDGSLPWSKSLTFVSAKILSSAVRSEITGACYTVRLNPSIQSFMFIPFYLSGCVHIYMLSPAIIVECRPSETLTPTSTVTLGWLPISIFRYCGDWGLRTRFVTFGRCQKQNQRRELKVRVRTTYLVREQMSMKLP
jgi:hypothetical protein